MTLVYSSGPFEAWATTTTDHLASSSVTSDGFSINFWYFVNKIFGISWKFSSKDSNTFAAFFGEKHQISLYGKAELKKPWVQLTHDGLKRISPSSPIMWKFSAPN
jgi:hypothetical protein